MASWDLSVGRNPPRNPPFPSFLYDRRENAVRFFFAPLFLGDYPFFPEFCQSQVFFSEGFSHRTLVRESGFWGGILGPETPHFGSPKTAKKVLIVLALFFRGSIFVTARFPEGFGSRTPFFVVVWFCLAVSTCFVWDFVLDTGSSFRRFRVPEFSSVRFRVRPFFSSLPSPSFLGVGSGSCSCLPSLCAAHGLLSFFSVCSLSAQAGSPLSLFSPFSLSSLSLSLACVSQTVYFQRVHLIAWNG